MYPLVPAPYHSVPVLATGEGSCWQALCLPVYCPKAAGDRLQVSALLHTVLYPKRQSSSTHAECISLAIIHFHDIFRLSLVFPLHVLFCCCAPQSNNIGPGVGSGPQQDNTGLVYWRKHGFYDDTLDFLSVYVFYISLCFAQLHTKWVNMMLHQ